MGLWGAQTPVFTHCWVLFECDINQFECDSDVLVAAESAEHLGCLIGLWSARIGEEALVGGAIYIRSGSARRWRDRLSGTTLHARYRRI